MTMNDPAQLPMPAGLKLPIHGPEPRRPNRATLAQLEGLSTATISTVLDRLGIRRSFVCGPLTRRPGAQVVAPVVTLQFMPIREDALSRPPGEEEESQTKRTALWAVLDVVRPGDVLMVAADGDRETGCLGEMLVTYLERRSARGLIVDGCIRDWPRIRDMDLPIWTNGLTPNHARQNTRFPWAYNVPVACGGVLVLPGDIAVADDDGVVVVPMGMAGAVSAKAREKQATEEFSRQRLREGGALQTYYPLSEAGRSEYERWRGDA